MSTEPVKILSASVQEVFKLIEIKAKQQHNNIDGGKLRQFSISMNDLFVYFLKF